MLVLSALLSPFALQGLAPRISLKLVVKTRAADSPDCSACFPFRQFPFMLPSASHLQLQGLGKRGSGRSGARNTSVGRGSGFGGKGEI